MSHALAPRYAGWVRRLGGQPGPLSGASASGEAPNGLLVEILVDGSWLDITARAMVRDNSGNISGFRGQTAEGQQPIPGTCTLQLNNRDGYFSTANPMSPLWGKIGRNTQIRWSMPNGETKCYRMWGQVPAWPEDWDLTGKDVWVDVAAAGILRKLNQGVSALASVLRRVIPLHPSLLAYWPMEDSAGSTQAASAVVGVAPLTTVGLTYGADSTLPASSPLPTLGAAAAITGVVPTYTGTGAWRVEFMCRIDQALTADLPLITVNTGGGASASQWIAGFRLLGGAFVREVFSSTTITTVVPTMNVFLGQWLRITLEVQESGGAVTVRFAENLDADDGAGFYSEFTATSTTVGVATSVTSTFDPEVEGSPIGHLAVYSTADRDRIVNNLPEVAAYTGETVSARLQRLCTEESIDYLQYGDSDDAMGPQRPETFLTLVQECVDVDQGILLERNDAFGIAYKTRRYLYNQDAALTLSYPGNQLSDIPRPVPDDANLRNQVTASRPSGSSATAVQETGPLSILDPPLGVGIYPDTPTINVATDGDLYQHAAWRVHLGTVDEPRYPAISINLASEAMAGLQAAALSVLMGDRIVITDPPGRLGGDISQIVIGISESKTAFEHRLTLVGQPESPYQVAKLNDPTRGRLQSGTTTLDTDADPTSATIQLATTGRRWIDSATFPSMFPFDVECGGEVMTVTAITGTTSPQTATVTRSVNGVTKSHPAGARVRVATPMILAL